MIVKICVKKFEKLEKQPTVLYDKFENLVYEYISEEQAKNLDPDANWVVSELGDSYVVISRSKPGPFSIVTNGVVYILNDAGKTIERIN